MSDSRDTEHLLEALWRDLADRYEKERALGKGGMAVVFLARDKKLDRRVALKVLSPEIASPTARERFLREIRITARLQHPNILPLIDSGLAGGLAYYVMPYVEGDSLREHISFQGKLTGFAAARLARGMARALSHAHAQGVVHRDIKPENILISSGQAVVADFGVAHAISGCGAEDGTLTMAGSAIGTPAYMSPEQAEGRSDLDGRSDVYALGCVLFEMLTGRPPFVGATPSSVMNQHLVTPAPPLRSLNAEAPEALATIVDRALRKRPEERFESAEAMGEALDLVEAGEAVRRSTPGHLTPEPVPAGSTICPPCEEAPGGRMRRKPALALATVGIALVLAFLVGIAFKTTRAVGRPQRYLASVVALPLDNLGDETQKHVAEGLTEEIIAQLSRVPGLKVISRTSAMAVKSRGLTIPKIGEELDVQHVLEGSVQRSENRIRVNLQLIEARTDHHVWSETYDREAGDVIALREEIGKSVAAALHTATGLPLPAKAEAQAADRAPAATAYDAYLQGRYCLARQTPEMLEGAIGDFEKAIAGSPGFAAAHAGLAEALRIKVEAGLRSPGGNSEDAYASLRRAAAAAGRAVRLDPSLPDGYTALGLLLAQAGAPPEQALPILRRAVELAPNSASARVAQGVGFARSGRYPEALAELEAGVGLDPLCVQTRGQELTLTAMGARQYEKALEEIRTSDKLSPGHPATPLFEGLVLLLMNRPADCAKLDLTLFPPLASMCRYSLGQSQEALRDLSGLAERYASGAYDRTYEPALLALAFAWVGDLERTLVWLEKGNEVYPLSTDFRFFDSGLFDKVRNEPRFRQALVRHQAATYARVFPKDGAP
ncbi:MAG: protein kinase [Acidobacteria bacterium]|nr:protein kinase [Acidobacteriota bacterium]